MTGKEDPKHIYIPEISRAKNQSNRTEQILKTLTQGNFSETDMKLHYVAGKVDQELPPPKYTSLKLLGINKK